MEALNQNLGLYQSEERDAREEVIQQVSLDASEDAAKGSIGSILSQGVGLGIGVSQLGSLLTKGTAAQAAFDKITSVLQMGQEKLAGANEPGSGGLLSDLAAAARGGAADGGGLRGALDGLAAAAKQKAAEKIAPIKDEVETKIADAKQQALDGLDAAKAQGKQALAQGKQMAEDAFDDGQSMLQETRSAAAQALGQAKDAAADAMEGVPTELDELVQRPELKESDIFAGLENDPEFGDALGDLLEPPKLVQQAGGIRPPTDLPDVEDVYARAMSGATRGIDVSALPEGAGGEVSLSAQQGYSLAANAATQAKTQVAQAAETIQNTVADAQDVATGVAQEGAQVATSAVQKAASFVGDAVDTATNAVAGAGETASSFATDVLATASEALGPLGIFVGIASGIASLAEEIRSSMNKKKEQEEQTQLQESTPVVSYQAPTTF
jgi:hypothetical protein